ncbi:LAME_0G11914g1_1 [Lachancea meyersii CBS 8951]|uniref:LAME_0G11914g1_1 n=1 Tax=Lachancea meyersii CBS 8951 TaxID=1266667 RepID=A0A1G4K9F8_9SACH|nr:LAME_0G11914g1_1 [Lachancea meyersii CBS 8951]
MLDNAHLLTNLRRFSLQQTLPVSSTWPVNRRSAVLVLLFVGKYGELRVLLTKRCRSLRSFSGHVSLPGGKADSATESPSMVARREAEEEIGLPRDEEVLLRDFRMNIERITDNIPHFLSRTFLSVKPVVSFLYNSETPLEKRYNLPLDGTRFFGKLNPGETTSLFSVPLADLTAYRHTDTTYQHEYLSRKLYKARWGDLKWCLQHYYYPNDNVKDTRWLNDIIDTSSGDEEMEGVPCKDVWGLTAKILQEISDIAHGDIAAGKAVGHEDLIYMLHKFGGQLKDRERSKWENDMIHNKSGVCYSDVIPDEHMEQLLSSEF